MVLQSQIWSFVPSAFVPSVTSRHLVLPKSLTWPPSNVHFCASAPVHAWMVTAAPFVLDAAVRHLPLLFPGSRSTGERYAGVWAVATRRKGSRRSVDLNIFLQRNERKCLEDLEGA